MNTSELSKLLNIKANSRIKLLAIFQSWVSTEIQRVPNFFSEYPELKCLAIVKSENGFQLLISQEPEKGVDYFYLQAIDNVIYTRDLGYGKVELCWDLDEERGQIELDSEGKRKDVYFRKRSMERKNPEEMKKLAFVFFSELEVAFGKTTPQPQKNKITIKARRRCSS